MEKTDWKAYLQKEIECSCGRTHFCDIEEILIEENAICRLPGILSRHSYKKLCVVCDEHTEKAAGFRVYENLQKKQDTTLARFFIMSRNWCRMNRP